MFVEVHHREGVRWEEIFDFIFQQLLVHPDKLETNCESCHKKKDAA